MGHIGRARSVRGLGDSERLGNQRMLRVTKPLSRFAVALGGFLIFVGIIVMGIFIIGILDPSLFESESLQNFQSLPLLLLLTIGLLDLVAGIILRRR